MNEMKLQTNTHRKRNNTDELLLPAGSAPLASVASLLFFNSFRVRRRTTYDSKTSRPQFSGQSEPSINLFHLVDEENTRQSNPHTHHFHFFLGDDNRKTKSLLFVLIGSHGPNDSLQTKWLGSSKILTEQGLRLSPRETRPSRLRNTQERQRNDMPRPQTRDETQSRWFQSIRGRQQVCVNPRPTSEPQCVCDLQTIDYKHKLQQQTVDKKDTHHSASERHSFPLSNVSAKTKTQVHAHTERDRAVVSSWWPLVSSTSRDPTCFFLFSVS